MSNPLIVHAHIYNKGKILNFKRLNEGSEKKDRKYVFSAYVISLPNLIYSCNNLNQIVGRNFLGIHKLLSYFGISKDPSEKLSKAPTNFNKFANLFRKGEYDNTLKEIKNLLENNSLKLKELEEKIDNLKPKESPINRSEVLDFTNKLKEIEEFLKQILGKE